MKRILFLLIFLPIMVFSQSKTITGTIKDETGLTLPGVTIQIKNTFRHK